MIKSYFLLAWRNLVKNKLSTIINIGGLSVGLATAILILFVVVNECNYDRFNIHGKDLYLLMNNTPLQDGITTGTASPGPLAAALRTEIPDLQYVARSVPGNAPVRNGDKQLNAQTITADPDFFNMMTFPAIAGNPVAALQLPGSAVITESMAKKIFGDASAMGKTFIIDDSTVVKVGAVIKDVPKNSYNRFEIALPFEAFELKNTWLKKWDDNRIATWVQARPNVQLDVLNAKLKKLFLQKQDEQKTLFAYPLLQLHLHGQFRNGKPSGGNIDTVWLLSLTGLFVLLIACINFMNLSTARAVRRAREVGMRKALGAGRRQLIFQFLSEALLLSMISLVIGTVLAKLALPGFMQLTGKTFTPAFDTWQLWALLLVTGVVTGLVAGSYPAFYLTHFQPVKVLKGAKLSTGKGGVLLRKGLVTFQFVISISMIIVTIVIYRQMHYLQNRPIGYDAQNLVDIPVSGPLADKFDLVKNECMQVAGVKSVSAGTDDLVQFGGAMNGMQWPGKTADQDFYITVTTVAYDWVKTTGLQLAEGRDFSPAYGADSATCLINESAMKKMGLKHPVVGTMLNSSTVVGVIKDFVFDNPSRMSKPLIIFLGQGKGMGHILVRINNDGQWQQHIAGIQQVITKLNPGHPFTFRFTAEKYQEQFEEVKGLELMANVFGGMAIFISCLGLFGLSAFLAEQRSKEVGIRKVMGANARSLWLLLSKDFMQPVFIAFAIAAPLAGWVMQKLLDQMDYRIALSAWIFVLSGVIALVIALATVSYHGIQAALINPVKSLKAGE